MMGGVLPAPMTTSKPTTCSFNVDHFSEVFAPLDLHVTTSYPHRWDLATIAVVNDDRDGGNAMGIHWESI